MTRSLPCCPCNTPCEHSSDNLPFMSAGEPFRFNRGDRIWTQGDRADSLVVVCTGHFKLTRIWPGEREPIVGLVHRGQMVGEESALEGARRHTSCTALSRGRGLRVYEDELRALLRRNPRHYERLLVMATARLQSFSQRMEELAEGSVEHRLARVLVHLSQEVGLPDARGTFLPLRLTRGDLADLVGCRVETTIRVMTRWQREGRIETQREGFVIAPNAGLSQFAA